jgi:signal transduction histidine kinase
MLAIVLIPSAALLIIGVGASSYLVYDGYQAQDWAKTMQSTVAPGTQLAALTQEERRLSLQLLGGNKSVAPALKQQRTKLDTLLGTLQGLNADLIKLNPDAIGETIAASQQVFGKLQTIRQGVDSGKASVRDVYDYYNQAVQIVKQGLQGIAKTAPDSETAVEETRATTLYDVADAMSRSNALALAGVTAGGMTDDNYQEFSREVGRYHTDLDSTVPVLSEPLQQRYAQLTRTAEWKQLGEMENALVLRGPRPAADTPDNRKLPLTTAEWQSAAGKVNDALLDIYSDHHRYAEGFAEQTGKTTFRNSLIAGGVILLVTIIAAFVAARLSNRVVRRMKRLRADTLDLAERRLPQMVLALRGGEQIDVRREVPQLDYGRDELGQVAEAFNKSQRTAVAAAAQEAEIQNGVKAVFLNIAHRSQVVVRRQLEVLDHVEREQEDPEQLEALFQLDHLATRARRNAENLIILGGEQPGRQWRNPQPLLEIVRSAISETEHYRRVHTSRLPDLLIAGSAVADVIHLLAELVDNATAFSPPDSRVEVRGNRVGKGVVVEVEDQGLGMPREEREELNAFLQDPPDFGVMALSEEARLGLFVVSQLAARHGIGVTLVDSAYGGVRAIVLIRSALIAGSGPNDVPQRGGLGDSRPSLPAPRREMSGPLSGPLSPLEQSGAGMTGPIASPQRDAWPNDMPELTGNTGGHTDSGMYDEMPSWPGQGMGNRPAAGPANGSEPTRGMMPNPMANGGAAAGNGGGVGGPLDARPPLPRRRRQASISPQLARDEYAAEQQGMPEDIDAERSAERARSRMSAFQRGSREGRATP